MNKDQEQTSLSKVDVMYIVGNGSINNNAELLYSLRMLSANAKNVGRVISLGDRCTRGKKAKIFDSQKVHGDGHRHGAICRMVNMI